MSFESSLKTHLSGDGGIAALVAERIHPLVLPQGAAGPSTKPSITYAKVGLQPQTDFDSGDGALLQIRVQVDCWAVAHSDAIALAELVRLRMQAATITASGFVTGEVFAQDVYDDEAKLYRITLDFSCWYRTA